MEKMIPKMRTAAYKNAEAAVIFPLEVWRYIAQYLEFIERKGQSSEKPR